jgi:hypothetical protein
VIAKGLMRNLLVRSASTACAALITCTAFSVPADAAGQKTPLAVARSAYKAARASHGKEDISSALSEAALSADYNVAILPDGFVTNYNTTIPGDHGTALLVNALHGGFGCVHVDLTDSVAPTTVRCPAPYFAYVVANPNGSNKKFLLATQVASGIGLESAYVAKARTASAVNAAVPKILNLVTGVIATHNDFGWTVSVRDVSVCLTFAPNGAYGVRNGSCK